MKVRACQQVRSRHRFPVPADVQDHVIEGVADLDDEPTSLGQLGDEHHHRPFGDVEEGIPVDGQVVRRDDEPVVGGLEPGELLERVQPDALDGQHFGDSLYPVRQRVAPQPGLHPQRIGVLLTFSNNSHPKSRPFASQQTSRG